MNFTNSTITYTEGAKVTTENNVGNESVFNYGKTAASPNTLNFINTTIDYQATDEGSSYSHQIICHQATGELNITTNSKTEFHYNYAGSDTNNYFIKSNGTLNLTDNGAAWIVGENAVTTGVALTNTGDYVAIKDADGDLYNPNKLTAGTYTSPVVMGLTNSKGASIKIPASTNDTASIRFVANMDADFFTALGGVSALQNGKLVLGSIVTADADFAGDFASATTLSTTTKDNSNWKWLTMNDSDVPTSYGVALYNIQDNTKTYCVTAYVTVTYADGTTATYYADYDTTANARSVQQVASAAAESGNYTSETLTALQALAGTDEGN